MSVGVQFEVRRHQRGILQSGAFVHLEILVEGAPHPDALVEHLAPGQSPQEGRGRGGARAGGRGRRAHLKAIWKKIGGNSFSHKCTSFAQLGGPLETTRTSHEGNVNTNTHHHDLTLPPCGMERSVHWGLKHTGRQLHDVWCTTSRVC